MVGIIYVVGELFDELEKLAHKGIVNLYYPSNQYNPTAVVASLQATSIVDSQHAPRSSGFIC